jgi:calcineurin-like phosphoesterase family protein
MNEHIIEQHNSVVPNNPNHLTIHLGDMFWHTMSAEEATKILFRLNGSHAVIYGNHDELMEKNSVLRRHFAWIVGSNKASGTEIITWNKHRITLNHFAQRVWDGSHKGHWHVYGHSHGALAGLGKSFDIGVDSHAFRPWTMEEIEAEMAKRPTHHTIDNTGRVEGVDVVNEGNSWMGGISVQRGPEGFYELPIQTGGQRATFDMRAGSTVHEPGCECGFCLNGDTKFNGGDYHALDRMDV